MITLFHPDGSIEVSSGDMALPDPKFIPEWRTYGGKPCQAWQSQGDVNFDASVMFAASHPELSFHILYGTVAVVTEAP